MEHFFLFYNQREGWQSKPLARRGADHAHVLLNEALQNASLKDNGTRRSPNRGKK
jgi:hypothetical protein